MNKSKLTFENLMIETTRKCNMRCAHCLRGDAQEVDIDYKYIDDLLDQAEVIGYLEITGGEPTLNLDALKYLLNGLCKRGIPLFGFSLFTNGLIYSEELIEIIKFCKKIIDISCENCISKKYGEYDPAKAIDRCNIGVSLDRYHEQHNICMEHYQKYKAALTGYADVRMMMRGNRPNKIGRAENLEEALDVDFKYDFSQKQRIELLSKDYTPICQNFAAYHMFHEDQKIVCCKLCMNVYGDISNESGHQWDWVRNDAYPKICTAKDSIWDSIIEYNKNKIPCAQFQKLLIEKGQKEFQPEKTLKWLNNPDAIDELNYSQKVINAKEKERLYKLEHPKNFLEAVNNVANEFRGYILAQKLLNKAKEHANKSWEQIAEEAAHHAYFDGDKRANAKPQTSTDQRMRPAVKCQDGLRCFWCGKTIQTSEGRNIHCTEVEQGLKCQYCGATNEVEDTAVTHK